MAALQLTTLQRTVQRTASGLLIAAMLGTVPTQAHSSSAAAGHAHPSSSSSHFTSPAPEARLTSRSNPFGGETWNNGARSQRNVLGGYDWYDRHGRLRLICRSNPLGGQTCVPQ
jgi:hypothetical protein